MSVFRHTINQIIQDSKVINLIKIAIIDDEKVIRDQMKQLIENRQYKNEKHKNRQPDYHIAAYASGEEFLTAKIYYDVIFLDIQMNGINGIDTARQLRQQQDESVLIFVTGIKEYVFEAFDVTAFHYLLKPIEEKKFHEVFDRAILEVEKHKKQNQEQLFIQTRFRNVTLNQSSILYIENRSKKVEIHTTDEVIEMYASMTQLEKQLNTSFYRCHRGYLVNMAYITEYESDSISLNNGETIFLAKDRYSDFVKAYMRYLRNGGTACV